MNSDLIWRVGSNGGYWYVTRHPDNCGGQVLSDRRGRYRRFGSQESAQKAADEANNERAA